MNMIGYLKAALLPAGLAMVCAATPAFAQAPAPSAAPAAIPAGPSDRASAYYNFAMAHLYAEMAGAYGNRGEYVNKAIDFYKQALKIDPTASYIEEELTDFYVQTGQLDKALQEAEALLKAHPDRASAHKVLARIYSRQIGDPDQGKVDQAMLKNAIAEYQKAADLDPKDTESLGMLARLSRVAHDDATAEKAYKQVLAQDPDDEDALNGLALVYADKGDFAGAVEMLKKAVEKNPEPRNVVMLAQFYDQAKDFENGAEAWKQAVALTNGNPKVLRAYATDLYAAGHFDEALKALQELAAGDPKDDKLQLQIAELLRNKKDYDGAAAALAKARAISDSPEARFANAELLNAQGKHAEAIAEMQKLLNDTKKDTYNQEDRGNRLEMLERLGTYQLAAGKTQDGVASFHEIAELDPSLGSRVATQTVLALRDAKEYKAARQEADAALKKYPTDKQVIEMHALLLGDLGLTDTALSELKALPIYLKDREVLLTYIAPIQDKAKRFDDERKTLDAADAVSKTPQEKEGVEFMRGAMFEREKNFDAAEKSFRKVLDGDANNAGALNYLGYMFADRGVRLDEAKQLISKALDIEPGNPAYLDSLAWVHYHQDQFDQAATELREALDKMGDDPTVHDHLGDVYLKQGKIREAIQQWESSVAEYKKAAPSDQDPVELAKVTKKLEGAKVRIAQMSH
jgi:tetratricopeptide (TPR) repeat protein